jgi:hypothetical protein
MDTGIASKNPATDYLRLHLVMEANILLTCVSYFYFKGYGIFFRGYLESGLAAGDHVDAHEQPQADVHKRLREV